VEGLGAETILMMQRKDATSRLRSAPLVCGGGAFTLRLVIAFDIKLRVFHEWLVEKWQSSFHALKMITRHVELAI